jgi:hypothetical protein
VLVIDFARLDGNPVAIVNRELAAFSTLLADRRGSAGVGA